MVVFILSFRSQNVAIKEAAYQSALNDYTDSIKLLLERPELGQIMDEMGTALLKPGERAESISANDRASFAYMLLNYSLFERVYLLHIKKWIDDDTWDQWHTWMKGWQDIGCSRRSTRDPRGRSTGGSRTWSRAP